MSFSSSVSCLSKLCLHACPAPPSLPCRAVVDGNHLSPSPLSARMFPNPSSVKSLNFAKITGEPPIPVAYRQISITSGWAEQFYGHPTFQEKLHNCDVHLKTVSMREKASEARSETFCLARTRWPGPATRTLLITLLKPYQKIGCKACTYSKNIFCTAWKC